MMASDVRRYLLLFMAVVLVACGNGLCTQAGCFSGATFEVDEMADWVGADHYVLEVCIEDDCYELNVDEESDYPPGGGLFVGTANDDNHPRRAEVTVTATTDDGTKRAASGVVEFEIQRPNGRSCPPTCGWADLSVVNQEVRNVRP